MKRSSVAIRSAVSMLRVHGSAHNLRLMSSTTSKQPLMHRILHGNQEAQEEIEQAVEAREVNFSQKIARGKYIHEIMTHWVKPECVQDYIKLMYDPDCYWMNRTDESEKLHTLGSPRIPFTKYIMSAPCKTLLERLGNLHTYGNTKAMQDTTRLRKSLGMPRNT